MYPGRYYGCSNHNVLSVWLLPSKQLVEVEATVELNLDMLYMITSTKDVFFCSIAVFVCLSVSNITQKVMNGVR